MGNAPASGSGAASPCNQLPLGVRVRVRGLTGAPEHNGTEGSISSSDSERGRYVVELGEKSLALRAANLLQLLPVKVRGADSDSWLDGEIVNFDEANGQLELNIAGDTDGPVLTAGARLTIHSLQAESAKQWNDCMGEILEYDEQASRYKLQVSPSEQLKVR